MDFILHHLKTIIIREENISIHHTLLLNYINMSSTYCPIPFSHPLLFAICTYLVFCRCHTNPVKAKQLLDDSNTSLGGSNMCASWAIWVSQGDYLWFVFQEKLHNIGMVVLGSKMEWRLSMLCISKSTHFTRLWLYITRYLLHISHNASWLGTNIRDLWLRCTIFATELKVQNTGPIQGALWDCTNGL